MIKGTRTLLSKSKPTSWEYKSSDLEIKKNPVSANSDSTIGS